MLGRDDLMRIAKLHNLRPWQQEKHYIQSLILLSLAEHPLVFKGDTYLWMHHGLKRFSEDLDFTTNGKLPKDLGARVSADLLLFGITNKLKLLDRLADSYSFRISAQGPLFTSEIDLCHVYVEISEREKIVNPPLSLRVHFDAYALPTKILSGMRLEEVAAEKVRAICTRDKARDLYDLQFLVRQKNIRPQIALIDEKMRYYDSNFSLKLFKKKVGEKKTLWKKELGGLLFDDLPDFTISSKSVCDWADALE